MILDCSDYYLLAIKEKKPYNNIRLKDSELPHSHFKLPLSLPDKCKMSYEEIRFQTYN